MPLINILAALCILMCPTSAARPEPVDIGFYSPTRLRSVIASWDTDDESARRIASKYFCNFATADPGTFFTEMHDTPVFAEWLKTVSTLTFTLDRLSCRDRECLLDTMVSDLRGAILDSPASDMRDKAVSVLSGIKIYATGDNRPVYRYTVKVMEQYISLWRSSKGDDKVILSDYLCDFVIENPAAFLGVMKRCGTLDGWMSSVERLSLVDWGNGRCYSVSCERKNMIESLSSINDPAVAGERDELVALLRAAVIRRVQ